MTYITGFVVLPLGHPQGRGFGGKGVKINFFLKMVKLYVKLNAMINLLHLQYKLSQWVTFGGQEGSKRGQVIFVQNIVMQHIKLYVMMNTMHC